MLKGLSCELLEVLVILLNMYSLKKITHFHYIFNHVALQKTERGRERENMSPN